MPPVLAYPASQSADILLPDQKVTNMVSRPTSITVIGWLLLIFGILGVIGSVSTIATVFVGNPEMERALASSPIPLPIQYGMMFAGTVMQLVCGYFMLRGRNWSRYVYVIWSLVGLVVGFATTPMKVFMIPGALMFAVMAFFLFRPEANAFFSGASGGAAIDPRSIPSNRKIASIVFYILAGFFFACTGTGSLMGASMPAVKILMLSFQVLPFAVCLMIARWISPDRQWRREVGLTILLSSVFGALMTILVASLFSSPEYQKKLPPEHLDLFTDYTFAAIWFGAWTLLGCALLYLGWNPSHEKLGDRKLPPIVGR